MCVCVCREGQGEGSVVDLREYQIQLFHFLGEEMKVEKGKDIHLDRLPSLHFPAGVQGLPQFLGSEEGCQAELPRRLIETIQREENSTQRKFDVPLK